MTKLPLINWNAVRLPKEKGGLGIRNPIMVKTRLGTKLAWKLIFESKQWWKGKVEGGL